MPPLLLLAQRAPALGLHVISVDPRHLLRVRVKVRVRVRVRVPSPSPSPSPSPKP